MSSGDQQISEASGTSSSGSNSLLKSKWRHGALVTRLQPAPKLPPHGKSQAPQQPPQQAAAVEAKSKDPLDYLARYCIVHAHRIPAYESAFKRAAAKQRFRYDRYRDIVREAEAANPGAAASAGVQRVSTLPEESTLLPPPPPLEAEPEGAVGAGEEQQRAGSASRLTAEEIYRIQLRRQVGVMHPGQKLDAMRSRLEASLPPTEPAASPADCELSKLKFILDSLNEKLAKIQDEMDQLTDTETNILANMAREEFWDTLSLEDHLEAVATGNGEVSKARQRKQPRKAKGKLDRDEAVRIKRLVGGLPSETVVHMLSAKQLKELRSAPSLQKISSQLLRCQQRAEHVVQRIADTKEQIRRLTLYGNTVFLEQQKENLPGEDFCREQSLLYQKLHPPIDLELNIDLVEVALKDINGHLITRKEMQYVYFILNLPTRSRVNFRLFSVIAALSEKVVQLEPIIRKMVNKMNFDALDYKLERCKELFFLLDNMDDAAPSGSITVDSLVVELLAGNLKDENVGSVIKKFNREKKGHIDFLDYLTYVPLFLEIHERIVSDPLNSEPAW